MKLTTGILLTTMMVTGAAFGQNPNIIQSTQDKLTAAEQQKVAKENEALGTPQSQSQTSAKPGVKPSPAGAKAAPKATKPLITVRPAAPAAKPTVTAAKPATPATKPAAPVTRTVVIAAKPAAPETKSTPTVKPAMPATKTAAATPAPSADKKDTKTAQTAPSKPAPTKIAVLPVAPSPKQGAQKTASAAKKPAAQAATPFAPHKAAKEAPKPAPSATDKAAASKEGAAPETPKAKKVITAEGRRDPFVSPVVSRATGPACSVGKRCLAIDQILVRGVVKSETGMIAVVVNSMNKAYFLKENDPVFNGYVMRITGDSVVFKETYQDRLGKELTREVVKKITTPAV